MQMSPSRCGASRGPTSHHAHRLQQLAAMAAVHASWAKFEALRCKVAAKLDRLLRGTPAHSTSSDLSRAYGHAFAACAELWAFQASERCGASEGGATSFAAPATA